MPAAAAKSTALTSPTVLLSLAAPFCSAEEQELWPLFAEHFSTEEQEHLVRPQLPGIPAAPLL